MWSKIILLTVLSTSGASASDGKFTFVQEDEPSPFVGTLFDPEATARIMANHKFLKEEYQLTLGFELEKQEKEFNLKYEQLQITLDTTIKKYDTILAIKDTEIEQLNKIIAKKPGKNALIWGIAGGFAVGVAATIGITYAVNK